MRLIRGRKDSGVPERVMILEPAGCRVQAARYFKRVRPNAKGSVRKVKEREREMDRCKARGLAAQVGQRRGPGA